MATAKGKSGYLCFAVGSSYRKVCDLGCISILIRRRKHMKIVISNGFRENPALSKFTLAAGFPPKELLNECRSRTVKETGLAGAAVAQNAV